MPTTTKTKTKPTGPVGINLQLPRDVHLALRLKAVEEGLTLSEALSAAVRVWTH